MKVAEDRVIQSYFYQIDQDTLPEVRFILMLGQDVYVVMIRLFIQVQLNLCKGPPKMSSQGGRLWEVVTFESLDHNRSKFFLIRIW